jgi:hypothetical protein
VQRLLLFVAFALATGGCSVTTSLDGIFEESEDATVDGADASLDGDEDGSIFPTEDGATDDSSMLDASVDTGTPPPPPSCGADGQGCCGGTSCNTGLECQGGTCHPPPPPPPCGGDGQGCCGSSCNAGLECQGGTCHPPPPPPPCGGAGQGCCGGSACTPGLVCSGGACTACGGLGQLCCAGGGCGGGTTCIGSTCRVCCALCKNRTAYHQVSVTSDCTAACTDYCAISDRGGLKDAMWGSCGP